jgi:hypothetical protein
MDAKELWNTRHALRVLSELEHDAGVDWIRKGGPRQPRAVNEPTPAAVIAAPSNEPIVTTPAQLPNEPARFIFLTKDHENPLLQQEPLASLFNNILKAMKLQPDAIGVVPLATGQHPMILTWVTELLADHPPAVLIPLGPDALRAVHPDPAASLLHLQGDPFPLDRHTCVATWDIAYLQRNPEAKKEAWKALQVALAL